jgi:hypothetical protein
VRHALSLSWLGTELRSSGNAFWAFFKLKPLVFPRQRYFAIKAQHQVMVNKNGKLLDAARISGKATWTKADCGPRQNAALPPRGLLLRPWLPPRAWMLEVRVSCKLGSLLIRD